MEWPHEYLLTPTNTRLQGARHPHRLADVLQVGDRFDDDVRHLVLLPLLHQALYRGVRVTPFRVLHKGYWYEEVLVYRLKMCL